MFEQKMYYVRQYHSQHSQLFTHLHFDHALHGCLLGIVNYIEDLSNLEEAQVSEEVSKWRQLMTLIPSQHLSSEVRELSTARDALASELDELQFVARQRGYTLAPMGTRPAVLSIDLSPTSIIF